ncbi:MAG TPA: hypothetical protein VLI04_17275 [Nocardioidaceae bacterium]|nr:hypothetical protein [Nocardioidaceae bacterium]
MVRALLAAALLALVAACGDDTGAGSATPPEETIVTTPADHRVAAAIAELATKEGVETTDIVVVESRDVTWPDGSLGCPQPGMSYIQAQTEGYQLVLSVDGRQFDYHGGTQGPLTLCENPMPPASTM